MKKTIVALSALSFSAAASAITCYQIFTPENALVWQDYRPPVRMDHSDIDGQVARMVPNGHLIIVDDRNTPCSSINKIPGKGKVISDKMMIPGEAKAAP